MSRQLYSQATKLGVINVSLCFRLPTLQLIFYRTGAELFTNLLLSLAFHISHAPLSTFVHPSSSLMHISFDSFCPLALPAAADVSEGQRC